MPEPLSPGALSACATFSLCAAVSVCCEGCPVGGGDGCVGAGASDPLVVSGFPSPLGAGLVGAEGGCVGAGALDPLVVPGFPSPLGAGLVGADCGGVASTAHSLVAVVTRVSSDRSPSRSTAATASRYDVPHSSSPSV